MKVLVTGATGFVGGQLAAELVRRGHTVRVLRRPQSKLLALQGLAVEHALGDILDADAVAAAAVGCDWVFHAAALASYWRAQRDAVYRVNVEGTRTVLAACQAVGVRRVVLTSSVAAIGIPRDGRVADEATPFDPLSATFAYADSKRLAEAEAHRAVAQGLDVVIVNPGAVIGPGDHNLISGSLIVAYTQRNIPFVTPGGLCVADVAAVTQGHILAAERGVTGERYILGGENLSHRAIARIITEMAGQPAPRWTLPRWILPPAAAAVDGLNRVSARPALVSGEQVRLSAFAAFYDSSKAVRDLGYPLLPFAAAAQQAYRWYADNGYLT